MLPPFVDTIAELILAEELAGNEWPTLMLALRNHISATRPDRIYLSIGALTGESENSYDLMNCSPGSSLYGRIWVVVQTVHRNNEGAVMAFVVKNRNGSGHNLIKQHQIIYLEDLTGLNLLSDRPAEIQEFMRRKMIPLKRTNGGASYASVSGQ